MELHGARPIDSDRREMTAGIFALLAQYERKLLSERVRAHGPMILLVIKAGKVGLDFCTDYY